MIKHGIVEGDELLAADAERIVEESCVLDALQCAYGLVARYSHSRRHLELKLRKREYSPGTVQRTLSRLEREGLVDDAVFAEDWARLRLARRPEGRMSLVSGLQKRGVDRELAEETVFGLVTDDIEYEHAWKFVEKLERTHVADDSAARPANQQRKLRAKLISRGFSIPIINRILREQCP